MNVELSVCIKIKEDILKEKYKISETSNELFCEHCGYEDDNSKAIYCCKCGRELSHKTYEKLVSLYQLKDFKQIMEIYKFVFFADFSIYTYNSKSETKISKLEDLNIKKLFNKEIGKPYWQMIINFLNKYEVLYDITFQLIFSDLNFIKENNYALL